MLTKRLTSKLLISYKPYFLRNSAFSILKLSHFLKYEPEIVKLKKRTVERCCFRTESWPKSDDNQVIVDKNIRLGVTV